MLSLPERHDNSDNDPPRGTGSDEHVLYAVGHFLTSFLF